MIFLKNILVYKKLLNEIHKEKRIICISCISFKCYCNKFIRIIYVLILYFIFINHNNFIYEYIKI